MRVLGKPAAVLFDLGGTLLNLVRWAPEAGTRAVMALAKNDRGIAAERIDEEVRLLDADLFARREASLLEVSPWSVQRLVYERLRIEFSVTPAEIESTFLRAARSWVPTPGIDEALRELKKNRVPMGVVSNSAFSSAALSNELSAHGLAHYFEFAISSADYVVRKPHPALFLTAAGKIGISPELTWYVGDTLAYDVAGSRSAGMTAIHYAPEKTDEVGAIPDASVSDWGEFVQLFREAAANPAAGAALHDA